ncbi:GNAT family N-acetyltransferase [Polluticoccus soli]|uniref:GNAT family N-acetyltransferase n=1 Tax=Polluticoccus soli TaxID=3034150 RepID=UPI0023E105C8|nr:N-acetyltransferase [Flavipsychrobacter sp. JY13-12]
MIEIQPMATIHELRVCARMMHTHFPWTELNFDLPACEAAFKGGFKENYVVKKKGDIIGFAILQVQGAFSGYIQSICILPAYRNQQIGTKLIRFCEERIHKTMPNVFLCVSSVNPDAQRFYYRHGYEKIGELKDHLVRGYDEYLLRKSQGPRDEFMLRKAEAEKQSVV